MSLVVVYFAAGCLLILRYNIIDLDAASRVANAGFAFLSRDPHLSAIGFVWSPLPTLVDMPFVWLSQWWPPLKTHVLAGTAQSSLFMAGAGVMLRTITIDLQLSTGWRRLAVAGFALHPIIVLFGQSGMSEAAQILCLLWSIRYLLLWLDTMLISHLAWAGVALGVGYLARYEFVVAAAGASVFVGVVSFLRSPTGSRVTTLASKMLVVILPIGVAFVVWALLSWVLAGDLIAQLSSRYGNANLVASTIERRWGGAKPAYSAWPVICGRIFSMQPLFVLATGAAVGISLWRRRFDLLVPLAVIAPILIFAVYGQRAPTTLGFCRFFITAIPLVACIAVILLRGSAASAERRPHANWPRHVGAALLCASVFVSIPVTTVTMVDNRTLDPGTHSAFKLILFPDRFYANEHTMRRLMINERPLAKFLDEQNLAPGTVLIDTANVWGVWLASSNPKQFVINSDFDFAAALNQPWRHGVRYVIVTNPSDANADAVNFRYPEMWENGGGMGDLVLTVAGPDGGELYRVYELTRPSDD